MSRKRSDRESAIIEPVLVRNFGAGNAQELRLVRPPVPDRDVLRRIGPGHGNCTMFPVTDPEPERVA